MKINQELLIGALALLEEATVSELFSLLELEIEPEDVVALETHSHVRFENGYYQLVDREKFLSAFEKKHRSHFHQLAERRINQLAKLYENGDRLVEDELAFCVKRLALNYLTEFHPGFLNLTERIQRWTFNNRSYQRWMVYFTSVKCIEQEQFEEAFELLERLIKEPDLEATLKAKALNSRSIGLRHVGRLEEAVEGYQQSLTIWHQLGDPLNVGKVLYNLGHVSYFLKEYEETEQRLVEALEIFQELGLHGLFASATNLLGLVALDKGRWTSAQESFHIYVETSQRLESEDSEGVGYLNLGEVALYLGQMDEAIEKLQLSITKMSRRVYHVDAYLGMGLAQLAQSKYEAAQSSFEHALALTQDIGRLDILPQVYHRMAQLAEVQGDGERAIEFSEMAVTAVEQNRSHVHNETLKIRFLGSWQQVYEWLILRCMAAGANEKAFFYAEKARARAFAESFGDVAINQEALSVAQLQRVLQKDDMVLSYFTTGVAERELPMIKALPDDNPLREILITPTQTICFEVTKESFTPVDTGLNPNHLAINNDQEGTKRFLNRRIRPVLSTHLLSSVNKKDRTNKLFIIPHGPLHHIPFAALGNRNAPLLRENGPTLVHAPSGAILFHHLSTTKQVDAVEVGGTAVAYAGHHAKTRLRYTACEADEICQIMGGDVLKSVPVDRLASRVAQSPWLHFACHGWFDQKRPLNSYLEIGPDQKLTAAEVISTWQLSAKLVTLSACQSGVSKLLRSDEPMGLVRAFLYAGARAVLVTQWSVEDLPTFLLMRRLYTLWQRGNETPAQALQQAQVWLQSQSRLEIVNTLRHINTLPEGWIQDVPKSKRPFADPAYWAAFIIFGDT